MVYHGFVKLFPPSPDGMMFNPWKFITTLSTERGIPEFFGWCAILAEFLGGLCLVTGFLTRPAALFVIITMLVAVFNIHMHDPWGKKEFALAYLVSALAFVVSGGGMYSIDARLSKRSE